MTIILKKNNFSLLLITFFLMLSCTTPADFNSYKAIDSKGWEAEKKIMFEFNVKDTILPKNVFVNIRNNNKYEYSNLYIITEMAFPNNTIIVDTLQYEMADDRGVFLGTGFSDIKENKLFYKERKTFPVSGKYTFSVRHAMRKNGEISPIQFLKGIQDVGLSIENYTK